jgi:hypothetical protein
MRRVPNGTSRVGMGLPDNERAAKLRERAAEFERLARQAQDSVVRHELRRLVVLYHAQADIAERGETPPADPAANS